jgi:hypothetical protein
MTPEEFLIDTYKKLDTMKAQIKARYVELNGHEPSTEELARQCWDVWRLTTFHVQAIEYVAGDGNGDASMPAPYIPPEFVSARAERIQAMDARLHEVLGDAVEVEDADEDEEDEDLFEFEPDANEQITMAESGSIIVEWRDFVGDMNPVQLSDGDEGYVMNIVPHYFDGFDELMRMLYECLTERLRMAQ